MSDVPGVGEGPPAKEAADSLPGNVAVESKKAGFENVYNTAKDVWNSASRTEGNVIANLPLAAGVSLSMASREALAQLGQAEGPDLDIEKIAGEILDKITDLLPNKIGFPTMAGAGLGMIVGGGYAGIKGKSIGLGVFLGGAGGAGIGNTLEK